MRKAQMISLLFLAVSIHFAMGQRVNDKLELKITNNTLIDNDAFISVDILLKNNSNKAIELSEFNNYSKIFAWADYSNKHLNAIINRENLATWVVYIEDSTGNLIEPFSTYTNELIYELDMTDFDKDEAIEWSKRNNLMPLSSNSLEDKRYNFYLDAAYILPGKSRSVSLKMSICSLFYEKLNKDEKYYLRVGYICTNKFKDELIEKYHYPSDLIFTGYVLSNKVPLTVE